MEKLEISGLEVTDTCYVQDGKEVTNFTLEVKKVTKENERTVEYAIQVNVSGKIYHIRVSPRQLKRHRFLQDFPVFIIDEEEFYKMLREAILKRQFNDDEIEYQTGRNGLQKINEEWVFVYTNGSISKDGFHREIYSGIKGAYFPEEAVFTHEENKEVIQELFQEYNCNPEVFYPLFLFNIMAITNGCFRIISGLIFMKLTLWIDGVSGSGKTELAKAAGMYTFSDKELNKELVSATAKRSYALKCLAQSSGLVCTLDDIKDEKVRERRNSVKNIVDDYIRSILQGRVTDTAGVNDGPAWLDACAIITGEYFETVESQNARILYLRVDNFLKEDKNSKALRVIQEHPTWLTSVCAGYIQWLLERMEEDSFPEMLKERLRSKRNGQKRYQDINNAERLNENCHMIEMAAELAEKYFGKAGMQEDFISRFKKNAGRSIKKITDDTFYLLGGEQMVAIKVMERVFLKYHIRKPCYYTEHMPSICQKYEHPKYEQKYFWLSDKDDFVWIDNYRESLATRKDKGNNQYDEKPYLIISQERLGELFRIELSEYSKETPISSEIFDRLQDHLFQVLRELQIIYKKNRSDNNWGRVAVQYPVYTLKTGACYASEGSKECEVDYASVIQMNTEHSCIEVLKDRMNNMDPEDLEVIYDDIRGWVLQGKNGETDIQDAAYKFRKAFPNGKSLFRK